MVLIGLWRGQAGETAAPATREVPQRYGVKCKIWLALIAIALDQATCGAGFTDFDKPDPL